jgi:hypothetical protein
MKILAFIIVIVMVLPVYGQRKKDETVTPAFTEGVVYSLPRTGIRVKVKAVKETFTPGPYAAYAEQLLGIKNVKTRPAVNWAIEDVEIDVFSEPDPEQTYKALGDGASAVSLTADGCLAGINTNTDNGKREQVVTNRTGQKKQMDNNFSFEYLTDIPLFTTGDSEDDTRPVRLTQEQKISRAAQRVMECRRLQFEIIAGQMDEFHPDGEAYKISLNELKKMENDYLGLFTGTSIYVKETFGFDYIPKSGGKSEAIFRVSEENGIVPATDLSGKPVMIEFDIDKELAQKTSGMIKSDNPAAGNKGVFYRIPGRATVKIISDLNVIAMARITVAQFGVVAPMPDELLFGEYSIEYNSETGSIQSIVKK